MSARDYSNGEITIRWQPEICQHSGICVKMLPEAYNPKDRPWIKIENASTEEFKEQVRKCPSGALSILEVAPIEIRHEDDGKKGTFYIDKSEKEIGLMTYVWSGQDKFIIDHTEINQKEEGMHYGKSLVLSAVAMAREKGVKIMPLCPFAKATFDKDPSLGDVLF